MTTTLFSTTIIAALPYYQFDRIVDQTFSTMYCNPLLQISRSLGWTYISSPIRGVRMAHTTPNPTAAAVTRRLDPSSVAMVVGASRGIGLAMVQALVSRSWKGKIIAACRDPDSAGALQALWQFMPDRFHILKMDICEEDSVSSRCIDKLKFFWNVFFGSGF